MTPTEGAGTFPHFLEESRGGGGNTEITKGGGVLEGLGDPLEGAQELQSQLLTVRSLRDSEPLSSAILCLAPSPWAPTVRSSG